MKKTEVEFALLRELYVDREWTSRFTELFDKKWKFSGEDTFLYLNSGSGDHAITLCERLDKNTQLLAVCETEELSKIAKAKAALLNADVEFLASKPYFKSDFVLADLSLVKPLELSDFVIRVVDLSKKRTAFFITTSGSFGEVFSYLWEVFLDSELDEKAAEVERLITILPTVSEAKETARKAGLRNVFAETGNETFEFGNGKEFMESPLIKYFLSPIWLDFLEGKGREKVLQNLAQKIDDELKGISFRFSVKSALIFGEKA